MKQKLYSLFLTALLGMLGMNAWAQDLSTTEIDGATYYEINDGDDLFAFAELVNTSEQGANAVLTADITLPGTWDSPIGISGKAYTGIFDGQGHKISGFEATSNSDGGGLFGITTGATIKNFSIYGVLSSESGTGSGVVGYPASSTIYNIHSYLEIYVPVGGVHHVGGVVGSARGGNTISKCTFSGTMNVAAGSTDNFAGVVAYLGGDSVSFCANYGTINFDDPGCAAGGIAGYLNNAGSYVKNCLNMGSVIYTESEGTPTYGGAFVGRLRTYDTAKLTGNCWLEGSAYGGGCDGGSDKLAATCFTEDQLSTGEICYLLNDDQSVIGWYQTIGTDEKPTLDATHAQVYMNGRLHCDGTLYEGASFTNEEVDVIQDEHNIVDGFCSYCGLYDENFLTPNADGFYEISSAKQLVWFEQKVNKGTLDANAILTADIDFADLMPEDADPDETEVAWTPIGDWGATRGTASAGYKGHFDGQGHTIKNLNATAKQNYFGVFGVISTDCLIENFDVYGTYKTSYQYTGGVAAYARDDRPTIRNCHSFVNINNTYAGGRQGGILGGVLTTTYKTTIENCTYSGTLDGNDAGGSGNYGGIIGYVNNNGNTVADITNCLFDGEVVNNNSAPGGCTFGGFVGYSNGGVVTIKNCLSIGHVESTVWGQFFGAVKSTKSSLPNSYYIGEILNGSASTVTLTATETNTDELASGQICWALNEESFIDPIWHQLINEQNYPVPYGNEGVVYQNNNGLYECIDPNDPTSITSFINNIIANETEFLEDLVAYQELIDAYKEEIQSWEDIETYEEFLAVYKAAAELKESIKTSAANYAKYIEECEAAAAYIEENNLQGETTNVLKTYLDKDNAVEPNAEVYPNGSYAYIIENLNLDDEAIAAEIVFVKQMLEAAVSADGIIPGNEISRLFTNTSFAEAFEGWTTENDGPALANGGTVDVMPIVRGLGKGTFSVYQTATNLPNGIYMMTTNAMFRAGTDIYSTFYAGQVFMNGTVNYVMTPGEDVVPEDEAEDGVNCLTSSDILFEGDEVTGYVPNGMTGCSYAFNAGRYENFCATEIADGTLTIGVRSLGTGMASDWLPFSDMHIFYLGTAEEANEKLTEVLEGYANRAQTIIDFVWSDYEDFAQYPNFSEDLKDQLQEAIDAVGDATTGEGKMNLINIFSDLFNQIHACRMAYIEMLGAANNLFDVLTALNDAGIVSDEVYNEWESEVTGTQNNYSAGDVTTEEALSIADKLNNANLIDLDIVDGAYQLGSAEDVQLFAVLVNSGFNVTKGVLTNDIDMSEVEDIQPIGSTGHHFTGEFDGKNHKVTGFGQYIQEEGEDEGYYTLSLSGDAQGFFGYAEGATIKNFSIEGAIEYLGGTGVGAIGWAAGTTLYNVHSALDIAIPVVSHHVGGVCGHLSENSSATNCSFSGSINDIAGTNDCIGGIGAYSNNGVKYTNCANYGTIIYKNSGAYAGGICGYVNNDSFTGIFNCINTGLVAEAGGGQSAGALVGRLRSHANSKFENNYILKGSATKASNDNNGADVLPGVPFVTAEQMASGEICYKLNGDQSEINWYQTLGTDEFPLLFDSHKTVYLLADGTYSNEQTSIQDGSEEHPFVVKSAADLSNLLNKLVSGRMNYVVMEDDVNMEGVTDWTPLYDIPDQSNGYPYIDFDGKGHIISNLTSNRSGSYAYCGVFGVLCGNVRNLGVENATVECEGGTGILAGYLGHSSYGQPCYIENVWVTGKITANGYCGGMFGNVANEAHIKNCYANVEVTGSGDLTGGIIGRVRAEVDMENVYAAGSINRGGGIIGGGFQDATDAGSYKNVAVWNNTEKNFGPARESDVQSGILYYDGTNFAELQEKVVAWDPQVWYCDMEEGSYPILSAFDPDGINGVKADENYQSTGIYNLAGQRLQKMQKGINIVNGKKIIIK
ncbi:MAG: hypothetical protein IKU02_06485 [Bacteroidaceae bacterium]|nr:hypothetical protein [Bacteroidaceae bacterium]